MVKKGNFSNFCFLFNIGQENVSYNILEWKNAILGFKNKKFKKSKINIFLKGLTHGFGPKMASFRTFFLKQYRPGKYLLQYSRTKNAILGYKNKKFKKPKTIIFTFFTYGFGPKMAIFQNFFFTQYRPGKCVYDILDGTNAFLGYEKEKFEKVEKLTFSKGVNPPWFWSKNGHFSTFFFLGNIGQKNVFYVILERKNAILGYKNKKFKKAKIWHFSKGFTHGF